MARSTFAASITELFNLLASDSAGTPRVTGVTKVYAYEPNNQSALKPVAVTITPDAMTPTHWRVALRVYQTLDIDAATAQSNIVSMVVGIDNLITSGFGPSDWTFEINTDTTVNAIVATNILEIVRADF